MKIKIYKTIILPVVKQRLLHQWKNAGQGYLKTGFWGENFDPKRMIMGGGEGSTMRNIIVYTVGLI